MTASLDFLVYCVGISCILVCFSYFMKTIHTLLSQRRHNKAFNDQQRIDSQNQVDLMNQRLNELRNAKFGAPMIKSK